MKKCAVLILVLAILLNNFALAAPIQMKNETVYINLGGYGEVEEINIYNKCILNGTTQINDYTKYSEVTNLTNKENYEKIENGISFNVSGENNFSYTGKVGEEYYNLIPWNFEISYKLNGVEVSPDKLLGSSGLVEINMNINANEKTNEYYKNNYILEITGSYDMSKYLSVSSDSAMITDNGNSKTVMFIVLPGQSTDFDIEIGTDNFEMDGITMAMVPLTGDLLNEVVELADDKKDMENAINSMNSSTDVVLDSLYGMNNGLNGISNGVTEIKNGLNELHGLNSLRDEDIENLKIILNDILPIIQNVQTDLDNLSSTYSKVIDLTDELTTETKKLSENLSNLDKNLKTLESLSKDLPDDVDELSKLMKDTSKVTKDMNSLLSSLTGVSSATQEELEKNLLLIASETEQIGANVENTLPLVADNATAKEALLKIGASANKIGENLGNVKSILNDMSGSMGNNDKLSSDLKELSSQLNKVSNILDGEDAEIVESTIKNIRKVTTSLKNMLDIATKYSDDLLKNKDDFYKTIDNAKQLVNELNEMDTLSLSMITNIQSMLNILSSDIYSGSDKTTDALLNVNRQLIGMASESISIKNSKNELKGIIDDKFDEVEDNTTIFNVNKDAKVVSFGNENNENVNSVQFILKTPDIKKVKVENDDMESSKENISFWDRLLVILDKLFGWITKIF